MTGCPERTVSYTGTVINASIQQSGICRAWSRYLEVAISALAKNPIGYVIIERESTSIMHIANICATDSTPYSLSYDYLTEDQLFNLL